MELQFLQHYYVRYLVMHYFQENFDTLSSSEPTLYQSDDEHMCGTTTTCKELDSEISDR